LPGTALDQQNAFAHNPAGQIVGHSRTNPAYAWTGARNLTRGHSVNGLNQYVLAGPAEFEHDRNGNLIRDTDLSTGLSTLFTYDQENRLVAASGQRNATLRYDPLGRLYEISGSSGTTRFLYDGDALVAEYAANGDLLRRYVHGSNAAADDPLVWYEGASLTQPRSLHADHQGSIVAIADASGAPGSGSGAGFAHINAYDEYGIPNPGAQRLLTTGGRFQYTGQAWLPELGMYHYKARIYSPTLGRFLQTDPIGYEDGINLYGYVGNDPVNHTDPTGMLQDSFELATRRDDLAYLRGEIDEDEYRQRQQARGAGGVIGGLLVAGGLATRGFGLPALGRSVASLVSRPSLRFSMTNTQFGAKVGRHLQEWGVRSGDRAGIERLRQRIIGMATRPERVVNGTFSGGGAGGRIAAQFRITGRDVVVTSRSGEFITVLRNGINSASVRNALREAGCTATRLC
jgi:RHS repeat-associated protein